MPTLILEFSDKPSENTKNSNAIPLCAPILAVDGTPDVSGALHSAVVVVTAVPSCFDHRGRVRDPNSPTQLVPIHDSGDHNHPNDWGYEAMANAIDLKLFKNGDGH